MTTRSGRPFRAGEMAEQALQDMLRKLIEDRQKREEEIERERVRREEERLQREREIAEERTRREEERLQREREIAEERTQREEERLQREREIAEERTRREEERLQREREIAEERTRREGEAREKSEEMRAHMDRLMKIVEEQKGASAPKVATELNVKLVALTERDDIESYLVTFERIMAAHNVDKGRWPHYLAPQLTEDVVLDTGAARTLVRDSLVPRNRYLNKFVSVQCVYGDYASYTF